MGFLYTSMEIFRPNKLQVLEYPLWFMDTIQKVIQTPVATPKLPSLRFELTQEAAQYNMSLVQAHNSSIHEYLWSQKDTYIYFGSEFRVLMVLENLLGHHPNWRKVKQILLNGSDWPLTPISESDRLAENRELIERGNHKSAL